MIGSCLRPMTSMSMRNSCRRYSPRLKIQVTVTDNQWTWLKGPVNGTGERKDTVYRNTVYRINQLDVTIFKRVDAKLWIIQVLETPMRPSDNGKTFLPFPCWFQP